ncbi:PucR family transcriptional regulator [Streptomyces sp. 1331.2]|uniref:PucR family transcriptional regulator n=1 Tax=Streptomyces sp. 1331.2 TaxID=1938835 RepID=UPI000BD5F314|nr:PucR family transcriptional regulator [Streptomyces sp. 1331.2]SOB86240.1 Purine catabolism regulatory protein-like family protein [Streptomyces sp. 1331.2]
MIVGDLLELDDLHIEVAWAGPHLLDREVTGVTSTDLQDPARYLQRGELVLSGLVWWRPDEGQAAMRFANALRIAEVAALLAGEGTHGTVPPELVEACRRHGIPLLSVPAGISFRSVTDRVYLRLWGDLQATDEGKAALPAAARRALSRLIRAEAALDEVLERAVADLGLPDCSLTTGAGRVLASSAPTTPWTEPRTSPRSTTAPVPVGLPGDSPFDGWLLQPHSEPGPTATTMLHGLAELLTPLATRARATATAQRHTGTRLIELLDSGADTEAERGLALSGLPARRRLTPVAARIDGLPESWTAAALAEALHELPDPFVAAPDGRGGAVALSPAPEEQIAQTLHRLLPRLEAVLPSRRRLRLGIGATVEPAADDLRAALVQARYALYTEPPGAVGRCSRITSLETLLRGVPAEITADFRRRVLAPLIEHDRTNTVSLLDTLDAFLRHSASWSRTAEALHLHVNTVHYRIKRIEELTGRNLLTLEDRLDLWAALRCVG